MKNIIIKNIEIILFKKYKFGNWHYIDILHVIFSGFDASLFRIEKGIWDNVKKWKFDFLFLSQLFWRNRKQKFNNRYKRNYGCLPKKHKIPINSFVKLIKLGEICDSYNKRRGILTNEEIIECSKKMEEYLDK